MRKYFKFIVPIICIVVVIITFYMIFDIRSKVEEVNYGTEDIELNEEKEDVIVEEQNVVEENTDLEDKNEDENATNTSQKEEISEKEDRYSKEKLDEAISLVQKAWGEDSTVYFTNEGLNSEGLYMVAARDKTSTTVRNYFKVNLDNKSVQVDY